MDCSERQGDNYGWLLSSDCVTRLGAMSHSLPAAWPRTARRCTLPPAQVWFGPRLKVKSRYFCAQLSVPSHHRQARAQASVRSSSLAELGTCVVLCARSIFVWTFVSKLGNVRIHIC